MLWLLAVALCVVVVLLALWLLSASRRPPAESRPRVNVIGTMMHTKRLSCIAEGDEEADIEMRLVRGGCQAWT
jgi:hypothetical protein